MAQSDMSLIGQLWDNKILMVALLAWFAAQLIKVLITLLIEKRLDMTRMVGLGGMPSSHSAIASAVTVGIGLRMGFNSALFALSCVMSLITMTDAAGVRRAAGQQAAMINKIVQDIISNGGDLPDETLKELLGHTPFQVMMGALLGILVALIFL